MPIKVKPDSEQLVQLRHCTRIDATSLANLAIKLSNLADPPLLPGQLLKEIKKTLSDDDAEALLPPLLSMGMLARSSDSKPVDVVKAFRSAQSRIRKRHGPDNFALLRRFAISILNRDTSKESTRKKRKRAAWDENYLLNSLAAII